MSLEIELQESEILRYQNSVNDQSHPMSFGISDRAVFIAREQHFKVDSYYMHRIPLEEIREVTLSRERGFRFWFFGIFVTTIGAAFTVGIFIAAQVLPERPPGLIAQAGAVGLVLVGLILLFDSRWRLVLNIQAKRSYKWKPSIFAKREEARTLQEDFLDACRYFGLETHRIDIINTREINAFWNWFEKNSSKDDFTKDKIAECAKNLSDSIDIEVEITGGRSFLIVTANYKKDLFPIVDEIVRNAPKIDGWTFIAFRPPRQIGREYVLADWTLDLSEIFFEAFSDGFYVAIVLYGKWERVEDYDAYEAGVALVQDLLGEYEYIMHLRGLEFAELGAEQPESVLIPVSDLPNYFENFFTIDASNQEH